MSGLIGSNNPNFGYLGATNASTSIGAATQAQMEAGSAVSVMVTPGRAQYHPSNAKAWVRFNGTGTVSIGASYNTNSITDNTTGDYTWNIETDFSSDQWALVGTCWITTTNTGALCRKNGVALAAGSANVTTFNIAGSGLSDANEVYLVGFGDQA